MIADASDQCNLRDLGGLVAGDGYRIRHRALLRSGSHHRLSPEAIQALRDSGIRRIVDLRWSRECEQHPSPFAGYPVYRHVPMLNDVLTYEPPADSYGPMMDHNRERIAAAFRAVAEAPPGGVLVHCHGGRDRTGVLVALLLSVAGVAPDAVADEYALTDGCSPVPMLNTLAHIDERYNGVTPYLAEAGVPAEFFDAVRDRLVAAQR